ncbi:nuclease-related domain-containing protein [Streptomyces sp. NPDC058625]|uniref:nuclease-related domain-containing protein n=1 Tax=Streptomyces sp. NPDC058625 TaxID=3346564 RepID=UPI00366595E5
MAMRSGAGQSAQSEYERRLHSWRTTARRRFLRGLPFVIVAAALLEWWVGWQTTGVPLYGHVTALAVIVAWCTFLAAPRHVTAWRAGAEGERKTARTLVPLARRGAIVLHDRAIPGSRANLDHLAIGHWGIAYIDTKNWQAKGAHVSISRDGSTLWYGRYPQNKTVSTTKWEAERATAALCRPLDGIPVHIQPVIAVHGAKVGRRGVLAFDGVIILEAHRLAAHLRRQRPVLSPDQITQIGEITNHALPPKQ